MDEKCEKCDGAGDGSTRSVSVGLGYPSGGTCSTSPGWWYSASSFV